MKTKRWKAVGASIAALGLAVWIYPVGGVIWSAEQVDRLAQVNGELRSETNSVHAIREAVAGVRTDRIRRVVAPVYGLDCRPRDLEFLVNGEWIPARVHCPDGFFLDFVPPPR